MIEIRKLLISDIPNVIELEIKYLGETLGKDLLESTTMAPYLYFYVAIVDEKLVGYIGSSILYEDSEILNFVVDEKYQRQGIGQLLLNQVLRKCAEKRADKITLEVKVTNIKGQNFYQKNGFTIINIRKKYYEDGSDAYLMLKEL